MSWTLVIARVRPAIVVLGLLQSACAGSGSGTSLQSQLPTTGSLSAQSTAASSDTTKSVECVAIDESLNESVQRMANLRAQANKEAAAPANNLNDAFQRMFGPPGAGNVALERYGRERQRATGFNAALSARGCPVANLDERVAKTTPEAEPSAAETSQTTEFGKSGELPAKF